MAAFDKQHVKDYLRVDSYCTITNIQKDYWIKFSRKVGPTNTLMAEFCGLRDGYNLALKTYQHQ